MDDDNIHYLKETDLLKPVPPRAHSDDWPCFLLAKATVYHPNGEIANLLHVALEGPFIVRGLLVVEKDRHRFRSSAQPPQCRESLWENSERLTATVIRSDRPPE